MKKAIHIIVAILSFAASAAQAGQLSGDWQRGDLIFQETTGPEAEMLKRATGSRYTHVGILRVTGGGPVVIEATQDGGVYENTLDVFLDRGVGRDYAIYRIKGLEPPEGWYHPLVLAASSYFGLPYDPSYGADTDAIYGSELVYLSALSSGIDLGAPERLGYLDVDNEAVRSFFLKNWKNDPDLKTELPSFEDYWAVKKERRINTPVSISESGSLELIYSTFDTR